MPEPRYAENPETGERLVTDDSGNWVPVRRATNDAGDTLEFFKGEWVSPASKQSPRLKMLPSHGQEVEQNGDGWKGLPAEATSLMASATGRVAGTGQDINIGLVTPLEAIVQSGRVLLEPNPTGLEQRLKTIRDIWTKPVQETGYLQVASDLVERRKQTEQFFTEQVLKPKALLKQNGDIDWNGVNPITNPRFYTNLIASEGPMLALQMHMGWKVYDTALKAGASSSEAIKAAAQFAGNQEAAEIAAASFSKALQKGQGVGKAMALAATEGVLAKAISSGVPYADKIVSKLGNGKVATRVGKVLEEGTEGLFYGSKAAQAGGAKGALVKAGTEGLEELGQEEVGMAVESVYDPTAYQSAKERRVASFLGGAALGGAMGAAMGGPKTGIAQEYIDNAARLSGKSVEEMAQAAQESKPTVAEPAPEVAILPKRTVYDVTLDMRSLTQEMDGLTANLERAQTRLSKATDPKIVKRNQTSITRIQDKIANIGGQLELLRAEAAELAPTPELGMRTQLGVAPGVEPVSYIQPTIQPEVQNALQVGAAEEVGQLPSGQEGVGGQEGGGVQQGVEGTQVSPQGTQEEVTPFSIPQQTIDRAVMIRNTANIARANLQSIPEGVRAGVDMRVREANNLVQNYQDTVNALAAQAKMPGSAGKVAREQLNVALKRLDAGLKRIQRDVDAAVKPHLEPAQQELQIKVDGQSHTVTNPADIEAISQAQAQHDQTVANLKQKRMTSAERAAAIKQSGDQLAETKRKAIKVKNRRTLEAVNNFKRNLISRPNDITFAMADALKIGVAVLQDLAEMGVESFGDFVRLLKQHMSALDVAKVTQMYGGLDRFYRASRNEYKQTGAMAGTQAGLRSANVTQSGMAADTQAQQGYPDGLAEDARLQGNGSTRMGMPVATGEMPTTEAGIQRRSSESDGSGQLDNGAGYAGTDATGNGVSGRSVPIRGLRGEEGGQAQERMAGRPGRNEGLDRGGKKVGRLRANAWTGTKDAGASKVDAVSIGESLAERGRAARAAGKSIDGWGSVEEGLSILRDPNASVETVFTPYMGMAVVVDGVNPSSGKRSIVTITSNLDGSDSFSMVTDNSDSAYLDFFTTFPELENYAPGHALEVMQGASAAAKKMGHNNMWGFFIDGKAASTALSFDGSTLDSIGTHASKVTMDVDSVLSGATQPSDVMRQVSEQIDRSMKIAKDYPNDPSVDRVNELLGNTKIQYLAAGLNPFVAIDQISGGKLSKALGGVDINNMTLSETVKAIKVIINGIGKTVLETTVKIMQKMGLDRDTASKIANLMHNFKTAPKDKPSIEDVVTSVAIGNQSPANLGPKASRKYVKAMRSGTRYLSMPVLIAMRHKRFRGFYDALQKYVNTISQVRSMGVDMSDAIKEMNGTDAEEQQLMRVLAAGTLYNENEGIVWSDQQLDQMGLNAKQKVAYRKIVKTMQRFQNRLITAYQTFFDQMKAKVTDEAKRAELDASFEEVKKSLNNKAYFPLNRFGRYSIKFINKETGKPVALSFRNGTTEDDVESAKRDVASQSAEVRKLMQDGKIEYRFRENADMKDFQKQGGVIFDAAMMRFLAAAKNIDPKILNDIEIAAAEAYINDSAKAHMQHRTGFPGYSLDLRQAVDNIPNIFANKIANLEHSNTLSDSREKLSQDAYDAEGRGEEYNPDIYNTAIEMHSAVKNPPPGGAVFDNVLLGGYVLGLGGATSSGITNLTQQVTIGLPVLGTFYGYNNAATAMAKGLAVASRLARFGALDGIEALPEEERLQTIVKAVREVIKNPKQADAVIKTLALAAASGSLQPKASMDLWNEDRGPIRVAAEKAKEKVANIAGYFMGKAEILNRIATIAAVAQLTFEHGSIQTDSDGGWSRTDPKQTDVEEIYQNAELLNAIINFNSGRGNKSLLELRAGNLGKLPLQFKKFAVNQAMTLHTVGLLNAAKAKKEGGSTVGAYSAPVVASYVASGLIGGAKAIPVLYALKVILDSFGPDDWDKFLEDWTDRIGNIISSHTGMSKERARWAVKYGLPGLLGEDMSNAMAPNIVMQQGGDTPREAALSALVGPMASTTFRVGGDLIKYRKDWKTAIESVLKDMTPRSVKGMTEAITGEVGVGAARKKLDAADRAKRFMTLQPAEMSDIRGNMAEKFEPMDDRKAFVEAMKQQLKLNPENSDYVNDKITEWQIQYMGTERGLTPRDMREIRGTVTGAEKRLMEAQN